MNLFPQIRDVLEIAESLETKKTDTEVAEHNREMVAKEKSFKQPRSPRGIKSDPKTPTGKQFENDALCELIIRYQRELAKMPREHDLKFLDPVSLYECKIEAILLLQRILPRYATVELTKDKISEKSAEKSQNDIFLGIEIGLLIEVLRER